jgi:CheY-like chemotaxis protein
LPFSKLPVNESGLRHTGDTGKIFSIKKLNILVADDDEVSFELIRNTVLMCTQKMLSAKTGSEAVDLCRQNTDVDLILMDIRMPEMTGFEAAQKIREFNKDVVIIAQTALGLAGDREKAIKSGCNDYIKKPIARNELLTLIQSYFKE